jgi:DHA2 family methylenomycin A resistance protein-like MFS transporter
MAINKSDGSHLKESFPKMDRRFYSRQMLDAERLELDMPILKPEARRRRTLFAVCFGFFLVLLDTTALNVATPVLGHEFGNRISDLQWIVNSYTLVFATLLLVAGAIGDRTGVKRSYQVGLILFTGASLLSALSTSLPVLILARVIQGLGAAIMVPASLAILSHTFPDPVERGHAVTTWANTASLGFAAGPVLGGILTAWIGWRSIFWLNVPVGIVAVWLNYYWTEEARVDSPRRIDWAGQATLGSALLALTFGLIEAGRQGWNSSLALAGFGCFILSLALFVWLERRSDHPVLPDFLFSKITFSTCIIVGFILNFSMYGILFVESLYLQTALSLGPFTAGIMITPFTLIPTIVSRLLGHRNGLPYLRPRISLGFAVAAIGSATLLATTFFPALWLIAIGLGILGASMGLIMPAMTAGVLISSDPKNSGLASGLLNSARQVGGTVGVALLGTIMQSFPMSAGFACAMGLTVAVLLAAAHVSRRLLARS